MAEFIRYLAASAAAMIVDFGLLFFLTEAIGVHYLISGALGFSAGLITVYLLSVYWVFQKRTSTSQSVEFVAFAAIGIGGLLLAEALLYSLTEWLGLWYMASRTLATGAVFAWNFLARKVLLFR